MQFILKFRLFLHSDIVFFLRKKLSVCVFSCSLSGVLLSCGLYINCCKSYFEQALIVLSLIYLTVTQAVATWVLCKTNMLSYIRDVKPVKEALFCHIFRNQKALETFFFFWERERVTTGVDTMLSVIVGFFLSIAWCTLPLRVISFQATGCTRHLVGEMLDMS